jgi:DnaJ-class molecular chaperone
VGKKDNDDMVICPLCNGSGKVAKMTCRLCGGSGKVPR